MNNIINLVNKLPTDIVNIIEEYVPKKEFVFTNKTNYQLYHHLIRPTIKTFETYIRDIIRRDNNFVFEMIVRENYLKWFEIKNYTYKNYAFKNYVYFLQISLYWYFCVPLDVICLLDFSPLPPRN